ncbi:MAG: hypothetical protein KDA22_02180 [Phycisphaerales bacterium]|nr:hypothetical protein [Phycisphaerales bacterium]
MSQDTPCPRSRNLPLVVLAVALGGASGTARGDLEPEWIAQLPVGSALSSGLQGMVVDDAGVTYVTGVAGPSSNTDVVVAAFAADGDLLWSQTYNGPGNWHDQGRAIALGPDGVVWVTGNTPGGGNYANVLLLKYDSSNGALLDSIQYSSGPFTSEYGGSIATDSDGNVYVGGGTVGDGSDGLVLSFEADGGFRWLRTYDGPAFGPFSQDHVRQVRVGPDGQPVAMIEGVMGSLHPDYVVIKYAAATGDVVWQTNWGVSGGDFPRDMEIDAAGDVYVTGTGINFTDMFSTIKLRGSDGVLLWQFYDGTGFHNSVRALALDGQGGVYITGSVDPDGDESNFNDNMYTIKRDASGGSQIWTHLYGANCIGCFDVPADVRVDSAGHALLAGSTSSPPYAADVILFVLDAETGIETTRGIVSGDANESAGAAILDFDAAENIHLAGRNYNVNSGAVEISVVRWASLVTGFFDLNSDGAIDGIDLGLLLGDWGPCRGCAADLNGNGVVDGADLGLLIGNWTG